MSTMNERDEEQQAMRKEAGDELDRLARELRTQNYGISYAEAFERVKAVNKNLVQKYLHGTTESGYIRAKGNLPRSSKKTGALLVTASATLDRAMELMKAEPGLSYPVAYKRAFEELSNA